MKRRSSLKAIAAPTGGQMRHPREDYSRIILLPILVILIFLVVDAEAQEKPPCGEWDADHVNWVRCEPKPVNDLEFALYATALWAATALDIESTRRTLDTCSTCREGNPLFGSDPSRAKMWVIMGGINTSVTYLSYRLKKKGKKWWMLPLIAPTASHGIAATWNFKLGGDQ